MVHYAMVLGAKDVGGSRVKEHSFVCGGIHCFDSCKNERDVEIMFEGIVKGVYLMQGFENKKNVNTGKPLTIEEMLSDINFMKENVAYLVHKSKALEGSDE